MLNAFIKNYYLLNDFAKYNYFLRASRPIRVFSLSPSNVSGILKHTIVTLDYKMVSIKDNRSELILLFIVNYITSEVLINTLIYPKEKVVD